MKRLIPTIIMALALLSSISAGVLFQANYQSAREHAAVLNIALSQELYNNAFLLGVTSLLMLCIAAMAATLVWPKKTV